VDGWKPQCNFNFCYLYHFDDFDKLFFADLDPTLRHSFWTLLIGGSIFWVNTNAINQNMMQRFDKKNQFELTGSQEWELVGSKMK
jgi:hypothetical protein